jgi:hypothetical protein
LKNITVLQRYFGVNQVKNSLSIYHCFVWFTNVKQICFKFLKFLKLNCTFQNVNIHMLNANRELRGSQSPTAASLEAHTALADTHSPPRMVQLSFADAEAPGVDGEDAAEPPTAPAPVAAAPTAASVAAFIDSMRLPLQEPLIKTPPRARTVRAVNNDWIPRRSDRLAAKSAFHDPQPEKKARRVMLNKWAGRPDDVVTNTPDATISTKFHEMFGDPVSSSKREAMREIFPMRGVRWTRTMARLDLSSGMHET